MKHIFFLPALVTAVALGAIYLALGTEAFILACILSVLEVTLSFDNAVVNAKVLKRMNDIWQRRFLTWGILVAVFGTRLVLPVIIVAVSVWVSPFTIAILAVTNPEAYGILLERSHYAIGAFGGAFLLMVSLKYFFDQAKEIHWLEMLEKRFSLWGRIEAIEIALALSLLFIVSFIERGEQGVILASGIFGIVLFIAMESITQMIGTSVSSFVQNNFALFVYLNILDTAFSLDGVIGAFALSTNLAVIAVGLGIGAYFVRTITVYLVRVRALDSLIYLEHGAHWAILGLACAMLVSIIVSVPEIFIGSIGICFIGFAYWSSKRESAALSG